MEVLASHRAGLGPLVESLLSEMGPGPLGHTFQVAHLPLLSPQLVAEVSGQADLFARVEEAGLPLVGAGPGWSRIADPVAEYLTAKVPMAEDVARRAAQAYERYGEDGAAISTLLAAGLPAEAAGVIGRLSPVRRAGVGAAGIRSYVAELPEAVLSQHPEVWLQSARASDADGQWASGPMPCNGAKRP